jgi:hypothetical protein
MYVPANAFNPPMSVEAKAAQSMKALLTFSAVRIIIDQADSATVHALRDALPVGADAAAWVQRLLRSPDHATRQAGLRVLAVRSAFAQRAFEWEDLRLITLMEMEDEAAQLKRDLLQASLDAPASGEGGDGSGGGGEAGGAPPA